jgi:hypothetical protein
MNLLNRIFRSYRAENGKKLSPWRQRMLAVDENYAMLLQMRDNENEQQKNKRQVNATRIVVDKETGKRKTVRYVAGVLATRDHGSPQEKLRKALGGKSMRRILKAERRAGRVDPEALVVHALDEQGERHPLVRGVDFAMIPRGHGGPTLVLHDRATKFEASYSSNFADALAAR